MKIDKKSLAAWAANERDRYEAALRQFVEIPSVSAEPERAADVRRCADEAAKLIGSFGGEAKVLETDGYPIVHGRF
ncbi:MAG TPA: peptidase, partial [Thermoanaerobaculia bacterium]